MNFLDFINKNKNENLNKAKDLYNRSFYTNALGYYFRALNAAEILNDKKAEAEAKKGVMFCYSLKYEYDRVLEYCDDLLTNYDLDSEQKELCLATKAFALNRKGQFRSAETILKDLVNSQSKRVKFRAHMDLGLLYYFLHRFSENRTIDLALSNFKDAYELAPSLNEKAFFKSLSNLGLCYLEMDELKQALDSFEQSLKFIQDEHSRAQVYNELGRVYAYLGEMEKSEDYFEEAAKYALHNGKFIILTYNLYYRGLVQMHQNKFNSAYNYLHTALYSFLEHKHYPEVVMIYKDLYEIFKNKNDLKAEYFMKEYHHYLNYIDPLGEE